MSRINQASRSGTPEKRASDGESGQCDRKQETCWKSRKTDAISEQPCVVQATIDFAFPKRNQGCLKLFKVSANLAKFARDENHPDVHFLGNKMILT
ncbi:hypothetical protein [Beijerinckia mobilis]|uniref:hypothetical protein n=1 Tax=Beijerinckia mobilis TaxID=231434 RepID=UPI0012EC1624|nr:hypothetical protein [Beijerinckia mobilis]